MSDESAKSPLENYTKINIKHTPKYFIPIFLLFHHYKLLLRWLRSIHLLHPFNRFLYGHSYK